MVSQAASAVDGGRMINTGTNALKHALHDRPARSTDGHVLRRATSEHGVASYVVIARAYGRTSSYVISDIGATDPGVARMAAALQNRRDVPGEGLCGAGDRCERQKSGTAKDRKCMGEIAALRGCVN
ncbi:MAG: hypothetical protein C5B57_02235 [Blastocatellia bacterium]|nr:MAG: hypothetical protein C5B57_02235 [Blastocatellia bacterium]